MKRRASVRPDTRCAQTIDVLQGTARKCRKGMLRAALF
jgi:hypothetical protein